MKIKISIGVLLCLIAACIYYFYPVNLSKNKLTIKCNYMAYACGDCYAQYRVKEVLDADVDIVKSILNTDIVIEFKDEQMEKDLDKSTSKCVICYDFNFTGELKQSKSKGTFFIAESVDYKLKNDSCCVEK